MLAPVNSDVMCPYFGADVEDNFSTVRVSALFTMLPADESPGTRSVTSGLRPNHNFFGPENRDMCMGQVEVVDDEWIQPGETREVVITFLLLPKWQKAVKPGFKWCIQAGGQHFANGEIIEILTAR